MYCTAGAALGRAEASRFRATLGSSTNRIARPGGTLDAFASPPSSVQFSWSSPQCTVGLTASSAGCEVYKTLVTLRTLSLFSLGHISLGEASSLPGLYRPRCSLQWGIIFRFHSEALRTHAPSRERSWQALSECGFPPRRFLFRAWLSAAVRQLCNPCKHLFRALYAAARRFYFCVEKAMQLRRWRCGEKRLSRG